MTNTFALNSFDPFSIGFDKTFKLLSSQLESVKTLGFPPYNIKKVSDNKYVIEMAVAGFSKNEVELTLEGGKLTVSGKSNSDPTPIENFLYKGIAERAFNRTFTLADSVEINNAEMINGILKIWLDNVIPDSKKPRKINIKDNS